MLPVDGAISSGFCLGEVMPVRVQILNAIVVAPYVGE